MKKIYFTYLLIFTILFFNPLFMGILFIFLPCSIIDNLCDSRFLSAPKNPEYYFIGGALFSTILIGSLIYKILNYTKKKFVLINFILSLEFLFFCFGVISKYYSSGYSIILINNLLGTIIQISFLIYLYSIVKESSFIIVSAIAFVQTIFTSLIIFSKKIPSLFNLPETLSITNNESQYYIHSIFSAIFVLTFLNGIWSIDNIKKTTLDKLKIFGVVFFIELLIHISMNYLISHTDEPNFPNFEIGRLTYLILFLFKLYAFLDFSKDDLIES